MTEHDHLDAPFALQQIQLDRAMALLRALAYWRTSPCRSVRARDAPAWSLGSAGYAGI